MSDIDRLVERLTELADWWETEYVTDDGWPLICANQLRAELKKVTR